MPLPGAKNKHRTGSNGKGSLGQEIMRNVMRDERLPPLYKCYLRASWILHSQAVQGDLECLNLEEGTHRLSRNVGKYPQIYAE
jgi:hypothetical protein